MHDVAEWDNKFTSQVKSSDSSALQYKVWLSKAEVRLYKLQIIE